MFPNKHFESRITLTFTLKTQGFIFKQSVLHMLQTCLIGTDNIFQQLLQFLRIVRKCKPVLHFM